MIIWKNINKSYGDTKVLHNMSNHIDAGEIVVVTGPSGSGKSTLLNILGLLEPYDSGEIRWWNEGSVRPFTRQAEALLRDRIGYLFQHFALIDHKTVRENLEIALEMQAIPQAEKNRKIFEALQTVGLEGFENKAIFACSGGEQQRVAIARLLLKPCELVLCDEPTGSLDEDNKRIVIDLLLSLHRQGKTLLIVSHDTEIRAIATRTITIPKRVAASPM